MLIAPLKVGPPPSLDYADEYGRRCAGIVRSGMFMLGDWTKQCEAKLKDMFGRPVLLFSSATDATEAYLRLEKPKRVIMPALAFSSTIAVCVKMGIEVELIDVNDMRLDLEELKRLDDGESPFLCSYVGGGVYKNMLDARSQFSADFIEDFSQSWGAAPAMNMPMTGSYGRYAICSFVATKTMHSGTGGMLVAPPEADLQALQCMREYGRMPDGVNTAALKYLGGSWRMTEMEAALLDLNMETWVQQQAARMQVLGRYEDNLPMYDWGAVVSNGYRAFIRVMDREKFRGILEDGGVGVPGNVYEAPPYQSEAFDDQPFRYKKLEGAEEWCRSYQVLPCHARMTEKEVGIVIKTVERALQ